MNLRKKISLPPVIRLSNSGGLEERSGGQMRVLPAGKAPKRRFSPGEFIWVENQLWEIMYAFRVRDNPSEWHYCLEERKTLSSKPTDAIGGILVGIGVGAKTPRIKYEVFLSSMDASMFFGEIVALGNRKTFTNKMLLQGKAEVRSSGEVISPK
jgi:hypothetical protein